MTPPPGAGRTSVHIVRLGCARNDVDSSELAARLADGGFRLVDDPDAADAVMVNTCGFIEAAKRDSINTLLEHTDSGRPVVAVGCMAERYGNRLAAELPEVDVLGFDDYDHIADRLTAIMRGQHAPAHPPRDRRRLLPVTPIDRQSAAVSTPGHGHPADLPPGVAPASGPRPVRRRLDGGPMAPLKIASGCDRRCSFCAIPSFRGAYLSRPPEEIIAEARWLAGQGVREVFLVSENTTSYGKDLGDLRCLERLLSELGRIEELARVRVSYLQPAELRPSLIEAMCTTPSVVPYFDLSVQHAAPGVLRRMRRFGDPESFLRLIGTIREAAPLAGIRSNVITGFPGETDDDVDLLADFLTAAGLDAIGVFGYSDEDGTEAAGLPGQVDPAEVEERRARIADLADDLVAQRAEDRVGEPVEVLVDDEGLDDDNQDGTRIGRAAHQGPDVDGATSLTGPGAGALEVGTLVHARVIDTLGVDLIARVEPAGDESRHG